MSKPTSRFRGATLNPVFHRQTKSEDDEKIPPAVLQSARLTGQLKLCSKGLNTVPENVWRYYDSDDVTEASFEHCLEKDRLWWSYEVLVNLDLSSNVLTEISPKITALYSLRTLNLQDNFIKTLPLEMKELKSLSKLNISHNQFTEIPKCVLKLTELKTLALSHNKIETVAKGICDLVMLQSLDMDNNIIRSLPSGIGFLVRLTKLNLSNNKLTALPSDIVNLRVLTMLDITHNDITSLPALSELRKLEILYANHNSIKEIPNCEGCECLQEIHLANNFIKELTSEFCEPMSHLKVLDLRDNQIEELPQNIIYLHHLVRLDVSNNELTDLPNSMCLLVHLQTLHVEGNKIKLIRRDVLQGGTARIQKFLQNRLTEGNNAENIPPSNIKHVNPSVDFPDRYAMRNAKAMNMGMKKLCYVPMEHFAEAKEANITSVDLCKNKMKEIPSGLSVLADNLTELNVSVNLLTTVPDFLSNFLRLQYLNLSGNMIETLPEGFQGLKNMRELNITNNKFTTIPVCVYEMERLEILLVHDNKLTEIDVNNMIKLKKLAVLDLANNNIDKIPCELGNMTQLRSLEITGNSFRQPRYAILAKGTDAILAYLRDRIPT